MSSIVCSCGKAVEIKPEWAGQWITCPACAGALYSPFPGSKPSTPTVLPSAGFEEFPADVQVEAPTRLCPMCAETIPVADAKCTFCGSNPNAAVPLPAPRPAPSPAPASGGDSGVAALIVGLVSYMFLCGLLSPVAWYLGAKYESNCRAKGIEPGGAGKAGKILGIIGTIFLGLGLVYLVGSLVVECL